MSTKPQDARHVPLSDVDKLRQDAAHAAEVRALHTNPDVVALRAERFRSQVDALMWAGLLVGLAFTMVNVQTFAAAGAATWSLPWLAAWLLDPMVSMVLVAVLRAEQLTARYQVPMRTDTIGPWVRRTKVFAFLATYTMNTWQSWAGLHIAGIVLHSVPPVMVYLAAETGPILRDRLTEAVLKAARPAHTPTTVQHAVNDTVNSGVTGVLNGHETAVAAPGVRRPARSRKPATQSRKGKQGRKLLADYVADARASWSPGVEITPSWARRASGCSAGLSSKVADALREQVAATHNEVHPATHTSADPGTETGREAA